jgi:hypothetical protein
MAIIPATSPVSSPVSRSGIAWSSTSRRRKGEIMLSPAERPMRASTVVRRAL